MSFIKESASGRIRLRHPQPSDDAEAARVRTHPEVRKHLPFLPKHTTVEAARRGRELRAAEPNAEGFTALWVNDDGSEVIAGWSRMFKIIKDHNRLELGIIVAPEFHGKGVATEILYLMMEMAFEERGMHRVTFETAASNSAMRGWLEMAGARMEGMKVDIWKAGDKYYDSAGYAILEDEWRNEVKPRLQEKIAKRTRREA